MVYTSSTFLVYGCKSLALVELVEPSLEHMGRYSTILIAVDPLAQEGLERELWLFRIDNLADESVKVEQELGTLLIRDAE